jgi:hypothetical protein
MARPEVSTADRVSIRDRQYIRSLSFCYFFSAQLRGEFGIVRSNRISEPDLHSPAVAFGPQISSFIASSNLRKNTYCKARERSVLAVLSFFESAAPGASSFFRFSGVSKRRPDINQKRIHSLWSFLPANFGLSTFRCGTKKNLGPVSYFLVCVKVQVGCNREIARPKLVFDWMDTVKPAAASA